MAFRNILVPTDFSPDATCALESAIELALLLSARVHVLHSYSIPLPLEVQPGFGPGIFAQLHTAAKSALAPIEKRLDEAGLAHECYLLALPPVMAILEYAKALPADLIVMGTHGRSGLPHVLLGSIAERVLRLAPCPVITVKAPRAEPPAMNPPDQGPTG